jgi:hypothetical protein
VDQPISHQKPMWQHWPYRESEHPHFGGVKTYHVTHMKTPHTAAMLQRDGIVRIALITHAWHMPRSLREFESAGLEVTPAPMGYIQNDVKPLLQWLPSGKGLRDSAWVLRECLGLWILKMLQKD